MLSVQFQEDKQSDTVGMILHTIVTNMITKRNYINIQDTPRLTGGENPIPLVTRSVVCESKDSQTLLESFQLAGATSDLYCPTPRTYKKMCPED